MISEIKKIRKARGLTQEQFADLLGVNRTSVSRWESGERFPDLEILEKMANVLEVPLNFSFNEQGLKRHHPLYNLLDELSNQMLDYLEEVTRAILKYPQKK